LSPSWQPDRVISHTNRLVHVEWTDYNEARIASEIPGGDGELSADIFAHDVDVVLEHGGDRDDGRALGHRARDESLQHKNAQSITMPVFAFSTQTQTNLDLLELLLSDVLLYQIHLVLQDNNIL
jgi:hypothetical protein